MGYFSSRTTNAHSRRRHNESGLRGVNGHRGLPIWCKEGHLERWIRCGQHMGLRRTREP
ncbi:30S ribosomal S15 [Gossypium arboreum]|uniref:30S ribosomal S15 n=1 Tax=Gossypium arboreum TaxID=29729 RepID=A0A0B0NC13_GOSAR|nr:30S ribosomal S15 [Gossypium arboreum]KHG17806.1 30S ribosomal S15 [Gossypium arboreum]